MNTAIICRSCHHHSSNARRLDGQKIGCLERGDKGPTGGDFECQYFYPLHQSNAIACAYRAPRYPNLRLEQEEELQQLLKRPLRLKLSQNRIGVRTIEICPPWASGDEYDVALDEDPSLKTNTEGGIRLDCTGVDDCYCNTGAREVALFAWECALGAAIAKSVESFEEFWVNPEQFVKSFPNPENYKIAIEEV